MTQSKKNDEGCSVGCRNKRPRRIRKREAYKNKVNDGSTGLAQGGSVGEINEQTKSTAPVLNKSNTQISGGSRIECVVARNPPQSHASLSDENPGGGLTIGDVSVGGSGIRVSNERWKAEHELSIAQKVGTLVKNNLGVSGT